MEMQLMQNSSFGILDNNNNNNATNNNNNNTNNSSRPVVTSDLNYNTQAAPPLTRNSSNNLSHLLRNSNNATTTNNNTNPNHNNDSLTRITIMKQRRRMSAAGRSKSFDRGTAFQNVKDRSKALNNNASFTKDSSDKSVDEGASRSRSHGLRGSTGTVPGLNNSPGRPNPSNVMQLDGSDPRRPGTMESMMPFASPKRGQSSGNSSSSDLHSLVKSVQMEKRKNSRTNLAGMMSPEQKSSGMRRSRGSAPSLAGLHGSRSNLSVARSNSGSSNRRETREERRQRRRDRKKGEKGGSDDGSNGSVVTDEDNHEKRPSRSSKKSSSSTALTGLQKINSLGQLNLDSDSSEKSGASAGGGGGSNFVWGSHKKSPTTTTTTTAKARNSNPFLQQAAGVTTPTDLASLASLPGTTSAAPLSSVLASAATTRRQTVASLNLGSNNSSGNTLSALESSLNNMTTNVMQRPSQFSTNSAQLARQFLQDEDEAPEQDGQPPSQNAENAAFLHHSHHSVVSNTSSAGGGDMFDSLEWNPEAQRQQQEEWRKKHPQPPYANPEKGAAGPYRSRLSRSTSDQDDLSSRQQQSRFFPQRPDLREVDQTINLMDASLTDLGIDGTKTGSSVQGDGTRRETFYSHQRRNKNNGSTSSNNNGGGGFLNAIHSTLVEVWMDERSSTNTNSSHLPHHLEDHASAGSTSSRLGLRKIKKPSRRDGGGYYRENTVWQDLCCSRMTILLILAAILGAFVAWQTGAFSTETDITAYVPGFNKNDNNQTDVNDVLDNATPPPAENEGALPDTSDLDAFEKFLVSQGISTKEELKTENSPQYLAWNWVTTMQDPTLLLTSMANEPLLDQVRVEAYAMAVLYYSTNEGKYNTTEQAFKKTSWRKNDNWMRPVPICRWYGVDCEGDNHVVHLNLTANNLKGPLPKELQVFSDLRTLDLSKNGIIGEMADKLFLSWPQLEYFWLFKNKLSGSLPSTAGNLTALQSIQLYENKLEGSLPAEMNQWLAVQSIALQKNQFTGRYEYSFVVECLVLLRS